MARRRRAFSWGNLLAAMLLLRGGEALRQRERPPPMTLDRESGTRSHMEIREEDFDHLDAYAGVAIAFEVTRVLEAKLLDLGLGGIELTERPVDPPYRLKDYDAIPGNGPTAWARRFDLSHWGLLSATEGGERVGGAVIAFQTPGLHMLGGQEDVAALWDLRVAPAFRRRGVGAALFAAALTWAKAAGARRLDVETQNVNVPACRFYASQGCTLAAMHRFAYAEFPEEVQLIWTRDLVDP